MRNKITQSQTKEIMFSRHFMAGLAHVKLHELNRVEPGLCLQFDLPRNIHNQKCCYWFNKLYFSHWILMDPQSRPRQLWGGICSMMKLQSTFGCWKTLLSFSHFPILIWPHYPQQLQCCGLTQQFSTTEPFAHFPPTSGMREKTENKIELMGWDKSCSLRQKRKMEAKMWL